MEDENGREDGELSDSDSNTCVNVYNPIVRPSSNMCVPRNVCQSVPSSDSESSSSESDSEFMSLPKRPKTQPSHMEIERNGMQENNRARKKNDIWANVLQEEELTLEIGGVGLKKLHGDRNVESYDYTQALKMHKQPQEEENPFEIEETEDDVKKRLMRKRRFYDNVGDAKKSDKSRSGNKPRHLVDINPKPDWDDLELGCAIADALFEQKPELVVRVVDVLGREKALELYKETQTVEREGGMMVLNGMRRRTSGGVFLQLLKSLEGVEKTHLAQIFAEDQKESQQWRKRKRANRKRDKGKVKAMDQTEEDGLHLKGLFSDDPGGTKCPGSTPVTSPNGSDSEDDGATTPNSRVKGSILLPLKEVCERAASEISRRDQSQVVDDIISEPTQHLRHEQMETC